MTLLESTFSVSHFIKHDGAIDIITANANERDAHAKQCRGASKNCRG